MNRYRHVQKTVASMMQVQLPAGPNAATEERDQEAVQLT